MSDLVIVIPCYNESSRLDVETYYSFAVSRPDVHLLFVDDGSADSTLQVLSGLAARTDNMAVHRLAVNGGKAEAVRQGMIYTLGSYQASYVGYFDADLATPLEEMMKIYDELRARSGYIIALGSRWQRLGSQIDRTWKRHYLGRIFATVVGFLLDIHIYDTQCGAKVLATDRLAEVVSEPFITRWLFDIELMMRLERIYGRAEMDSWAVEVPLQRWREVGNSRVGLRDFVRAPLELLRIRLQYRKRF